MDQLTALYQAAFPATGLILLPPWRREKQGGCKDIRMLAGNPSDHPDDVSDCMTLPVERDPRAREEMGRADPRPPPHQGWTSARATGPLYKQLRAARKTLYYGPLSQREPGESPREQMLTSLPGAEASGQVNLLGKSAALLAVPEIMHLPHYLCACS